MCTKFQVTVYASKFSLASEVFFLSLSAPFASFFCCILRCWFVIVLLCTCSLSCSARVYVCSVFLWMCVCGIAAAAFVVFVSVLPLAGKLLKQTSVQLQFVAHFLVPQLPNYNYQCSTHKHKENCDCMWMIVCVWKYKVRVSDSKRMCVCVRVRVCVDAVAKGVLEEDFWMPFAQNPHSQ